jgi:hypothetical protein
MLLPPVYVAAGFVVFWIVMSRDLRRLQLVWLTQLCQLWVLFNSVSPAVAGKIRAGTPIAVAKKSSLLCKYHKRPRTASATLRAQGTKKLLKLSLTTRGFISTRPRCMVRTKRAGVGARPAAAKDLRLGYLAAARMPNLVEAMETGLRELG